MKKLITSPFFFLLFYTLIISYFISYVPSKSLPELEVGQIAPQDIMAPFDITIEDKETTEQRRREAEEAVLPVYTLNKNIILNTEEKIREFFSFGREYLQQKPAQRSRAEFKQIIQERFGLELSLQDISLLWQLGFSPHLEDLLVKLLGKVSASGIIATKNLFIRKEPERGFNLVVGERENFTTVDEILDIQEAKEKLSQEIKSLELASKEKAILQKLSHLFVTPNLTFDKMTTEERRQQARDNISPVFYTIKKGQVIIRKGDEVTTETVKQINIINQNLQKQSGWLINFLGTILLFTLLLVILWYYLKSISRKEDTIRLFNLMGSTLVLSVVIYKISVFLAEVFSTNASLPFFQHTESYYYAIPIQFGVLLFAFLTRIHTSLVYTVFNSLLIGYFFKFNFDLVLLALLAGFAAIYGIKYYGRQSRTNVFKSGFALIIPINILVIIILHLAKESLSSFSTISFQLLMGVIGGTLSAVLAYLLLPIFESIFQIVTPARLLELSNSDLPIFRKMAIEAPGTYHHSLIVATLAEKAAESLRLDPMLVKTGALYHDIGKLKMPEYFIENKNRGLDLHKDLKPSMSTLVIINHVKEGLEQAKKLKLPKKIKEIIEQHHGASLVKYFFEKAKEEYDPEMHKIGEENYRYPGPPPKSKEAALIMLADSVEAASRSLKNPTRSNLKNVIEDIINYYLQDGQLDESGFSIKELKIIADSFLETLDTIYHHRVEYPGFNFERKPAPGKKSKGGQPTKARKT
ncbi:HDIG domain-containing protein [Candidatus Aminicenantes bacterium AC-334-K16]|nr:HDIG domain-containing protein [Candidatus Aminicenantes bacterium AC-334-K16]